ncbi:MAG: hypothetical protein EHM39_00940 [Chloroflexi bacterium]|nr:MAG: hypothetical protein EHM39_00940 [Chloroflexota bacterium]
MNHEQLKQQLGEAAYTQLLTDLTTLDREAHQRGVEEGRGFWGRLAGGVWRSRTMWAAGIIGLVPQLEVAWPLIQPLLAAAGYGNVITGIAIAFALLRGATTDSLIEKTRRKNERAGDAPEQEIILPPAKS